MSVPRDRRASRAIVRVRSAVRLTVLMIACHAGESAAQEPPSASEPAGGGPPIFVPRFTLVEVQYPQLVASSVGTWILLPTPWEHRLGAVADITLGLSGASLAVGGGATSSATTSFEQASSLGVQGLLHRTWPGWSPWLASSATFGGAEAFAHLFGIRCSLGVLMPLASGRAAAPFVIGGVGVGLP